MSRVAAVLLVLACLVSGCTVSCGRVDTTAADINQARQLPHVAGR
jgi:hypothetical protein